MMGCYAQVLVEAAQKKPEGRRKFQIPISRKYQALSFLGHLKRSALTPVGYIGFGSSEFGDSSGC
jgi:hypothetical protein